MKFAQNIKVVYILNSSNKYGGASKSFISMLKGLIQFGVKPYIITVERGGLCDTFEQMDIEYFIYKYFLHIYPPIKSSRDYILFLPRLFRTLFYNHRAKIKLTKIIKKIEPDIIHTNVGPLQIGDKIARKLDIPHIWHIREYQGFNFSWLSLYSMTQFKSKLQNSNNHCIAITKALFNYFQLNISKDKVIYNGVLKGTDVKFIYKKEKYFLFAGRLEANKGIQDLINIFIEFAKTDKEYKLLIAGDTNSNLYKEKIYKIVEDANMTERIVFLGMRDDIYTLMSTATALIVPSVFEGFGRITAEAMFNGCLVIGKNTGGTKEILEQNSLGLLYNNDGELLNKINEVVTNGISYYFPMIEKSQKYAIKMYSQEQNYKATYEFYQEIINK